MFKYCVILSGGKGSRLFPLTKNTPKALIKIHNQPLIFYTLKQLVGNVDVIGVTVGVHYRQIARYAIGNGVHFLINTIDKGNGWWIFNTPFKDINAPVLVVPCDNLVKLDFTFLYNCYQELENPACMIVPTTPIKEIVGDFIQFDEKGSVCALTREKESPLYSSGIQVINPFLLNKHLKKGNDFMEIWNLLIQQNLLFSTPVYPYKWYSINNTEQLKVAESEMSDHLKYL